MSFFFLQVLHEYRRTPKNLDTRKFAVNTITVEQGGFTIE